MSNFLFSLNVTIPIFLVMVIGYFLRRIGMLNDNFVTVANKFNFKVTLPFLLFRDLSTVDIISIFDWKYVLFCAAGYVCGLLGFLGGGKADAERPFPAGRFHAGGFPKQRGSYGSGFYPEYLRAIHNGIIDDYRCRPVV